MSEKLHQHLSAALAATPVGRLCIAFSGGPDSTALLYALAQLPQARGRGLRAVHVDHGLHPQSAEWAEHCARFCASLAVPIAILRVQPVPGREGPEAAARHARYAAFERTLRPGEWLVLAQHRDDQIETVLLKLLRGAGPEGLGGMRGSRPFAGGMLWRPLLDVPRDTLHGYVAAHGLEFIEDPSNRDPAFSRNFLRAEILPRLNARWPHAAQSIAHAAELCRAAAQHLEILADEALQRLVRGEDGMDAAGWSELPDALRGLVLQRWLHRQRLPAPTRAQAAELRRQIHETRADHVPRVAWTGAEVRLWRGVLHAMAPSRAMPRDWGSPWDGTPLPLPDGGELVLRASTAGVTPLLESPLRVRYRRGGERIRPDGDAHTRELRDLLQRAGIPPWRRARIPLIFRDDDLLAVADLWTSETGRAYFEALGAVPHWRRAD